MPTSLTETAWSFNAANNASDSYKTNYTDRWEHIKAPLLGSKRYQRMALTSQYQSQRLESKATYIKPSHCQHKVHTKKKPTLWKDTNCHFAILFHFTKHFLVLTLASETLWQAAHRWPHWKEQSFHLRRYLDESSDPSRCIHLDWWSHASSKGIIIWALF